MSIFNDWKRTNRAKQLGQFKEEYNQINNKSYKTTEDYEKLKKLAGQIAALKEKNKIASEKSNQTNIKIDNSTKETRASISINNNNKTEKTNNVGNHYGSKKN